MLKEIELLLIAFILCISTVFAQSPTHTININQSYEIGAIYNMTGRYSTIDRPSAEGAIVAVDAINKQGGLLGRQVKLVLRDSKGDESLEKKIATEFAKDPNVNIMIGLNSTREVSDVAPILAAAHKIIITTGATSFGLVQQVPHYLFFICFSNNVQAAAAAEYVFEFLYKKSGAIFYDETRQYATELYQYFSERLKELGGEIVLTQTFAHDNYNIDKQIKALKALPKEPEFIYLAAGPTEGPAIIKQLRDAGYQGLIVGGDAFTAKKLLSVLGDTANNITYTTHGVINPEFTNLLPALMRQYLATQNFFKVFQDYYHRLPESVYAALGYDAVNLIAAAINRGQSFEVENIIKALHHLDPFVGVTGKISYVNGQTVPIKTVSIIQIENGKPSFIGNWIPVKVPEYKEPSSNNN